MNNIHPLFREILNQHTRFYIPKCDACVHYEAPTKSLVCRNCKADDLVEVEDEKDD